AGGSWLVRIDDIDPPREVDGAAQQQLAALQTFGMPPDAAPLFQSTRAGAYRRALEQLDAAGLLYARRCSRTQLAAWSGIHPARCVAGASDCRSPAWRVRVGDADIAFVDGIQGPVRQQLAREVGDFVVWRSDGLAAYQLAVVVDDADQRIS